MPINRSASRSADGLVAIVGAAGDLARLLGGDVDQLLYPVSEIDQENAG